MLFFFFSLKSKIFPIENWYSLRKWTFQTDTDDTTTYRQFWILENAFHGDCQFWMEILHFRILYSGRFLRHIGFPLLDSTFESFLLNYKVVVQSFRLKLNLLFALSFCRFCERQKSTQVGIYI